MTDAEATQLDAEMLSMRADGPLCEFIAHALQAIEDRAALVSSYEYDHIARAGYVAFGKAVIAARRHMRGEK